MLRSGRLDAYFFYVHAHCIREALAHLHDMRSQFGLLQSYGYICIGKRKTAQMHAGNHFLQKQNAGDAFIGRISIREQMPYISLRKGTEYRITKRMNSYIPI